jgi:hypothetical protein
MSTEIPNICGHGFVPRKITMLVRSNSRPTRNSYRLQTRSSTLSMESSWLVDRKEETRVAGPSLRSGRGGSNCPRKLGMKPELRDHINNSKCTHMNDLALPTSVPYWYLVAIVFKCKIGKETFPTGSDSGLSVERVLNSMVQSSSTLQRKHQTGKLGHNPKGAIQVARRRREI